MVYEHAALVEVQPDGKVVLKPGKQESEVEYGQEVVEENGEKRMKGKKYRLIRNVKLPFVMSEGEFKAWKRTNKRVKEVLEETQKSVGA